MQTMYVVFTIKYKILKIYQKNFEKIKKKHTQG